MASHIFRAGSQPNLRQSQIPFKSVLAQCWHCLLYTSCPKRTGFNKLLFPDVRKDSCTSPDCFRAKIDASVKKTLETKPQLIQISAAWNSREGAPLGRNQYVELEIKKAKRCV